MTYDGREGPSGGGDGGHGTVPGEMDVPGIRNIQSLSSGGTSWIYAAHRQSDGLDVVVKVLRHRREDAPEAAARLDREAELLQCMVHPNIVPILGAGTLPSGHPYLVLRRIHGLSLKQHLESGALPPPTAWSLVRQVALAVQAAHRSGILHRDLSPSNILLDGKSRAFLTDFGLAKRPVNPAVTRDGEALGTPGYMAPEQWWGAEADERTDVYGLGAVLYECLCGRPPWSPEDPGKSLHQLAVGDPPLPSSFAQALSPEMDAFVMRCLARSASDRPQDVATFLREGDALFVPLAPPSPWKARLIGGGFLALPFLIGYREAHLPTDLLRAGGIFVFAPLTVFVLAALLGSPAVAALAASMMITLGAIGTSLGFEATMSHVASSPAEQRFVAFHVGLSEALVNLFLACGLAATVLMKEMGRSLTLDYPGVIRTGMAAATLCVCALIGDAGTFVLGIAGALILFSYPLPGPSAPVHRLGPVLAMVSLLLLATSRYVGEMMGIWGDGLSRRVRMETLTGLELGLVPLLLVGCVATGAVTMLIRPSLRQITRQWSGRIILASAALTLLVLLGSTLSVRQHRERLWADLAPHFALWGELDPPDARSDPPFRMGPTLQIGRQTLAVDGTTVCPRAAVTGPSEIGLLLVAQALGTRIRLQAEGPHLVLAVDRSIPWAEVRRLLATVYDLGVRQVDLLTEHDSGGLRGPRTPESAVLALPADLRAVRSHLTREEGVAAVLPGNATFQDVVESLRQHPSRNLSVRP